MRRFEAHEDRLPELPEVETVRRGLEPVMAGQVMTKVEVRRDGLRWPFPDNMAGRLQGQKVLRLRRRSKYLLLDLGSDETLIIHLGMSGRMLIDRAAQGNFALAQPAYEKHDHVVLIMESGVVIAFNDARRFGAMDICVTGAENAHRLLAVLGPEPMGNEFSDAYLKAALAGRKTPIKSALLDQKIVAGLGNIYVCEALWRAGVSPLRLARDVKGKEIGPLITVIRDILAQAIDSGGSSLKDFRKTDGNLGYFQHNFSVYGRENESCRRTDCKGKIARTPQSGRSSFHCPVCQI